MGKKNERKKNGKGGHWKDVRVWDRELNWSTTKNYVEMLRERGDILSVGRVDVDVPQVVQRRFLCDSHRCIHWAGKKPLIDRSCCTRYDVPVTTRDREVVNSRLDEVRRNLPADHRLQDPGEEAFRQNDEFGWELVHDGPGGTCQFTIYEDGMRLCALHMTALQNGDNPMDYKPFACSYWPLALDEYADDGKPRWLLTVYTEETQDLFDDVDDEPFACILDNDPSYPRMYESERSILEYTFGNDWWSQLDHAARKLLKSAPQGQSVGG